MVGFKGKKRSWEQRRCMGRVSNTPHLVPAFSQFLRFYFLLQTYCSAVQSTYMSDSSIERNDVVDK